MYLRFQHGAGLHNNNVQLVKPYTFVTKQQSFLIITSHGPAYGIVLRHTNPGFKRLKLLVRNKPSTVSIIETHTQSDSRQEASSMGQRLVGWLVGWLVTGAKGVKG